jgi:hypothetical protein
VTVEVAQQEHVPLPRQRLEQLPMKAKDHSQQRSS